MAAGRGIEGEMEKLAVIASLYLDDTEKVEMGRRLSALLAVLSSIQKVDTAGIEPLAHGSAPLPGFREDRVEPSLQVRDVFENTSHENDGYFRVPSIAGDESDDL